MTNLLIGIVGKPSSGKSTFLNAICNTDAKMASYPFTTLEPNLGITYYRTKCLCSNKEMNYKCETHLDKCENGNRLIPIRIIDVPGLIPGASTGKGLGNRFLDAIRKAHVLLHILDASGSTDERGETIQGSFYDCSQDVKWIWDEIIEWIFNNFYGRWDRIVKIFKLNKCTLEDLFLKYLGGYSTNRRMLRKYLSVLNIESREFFLRNYFPGKQKSNNKNEEEEEEEQTEQQRESEKEFLRKDRFTIEHWKREHVYDFIKEFVHLRFPLVLVMNKTDLPGSTQNIMNIYRTYPNIPAQPCSSLGELYLKRFQKQGLISYLQGDETFTVIKKKDDGDDGDNNNKTTNKMDGKTKKLLRRIRKKVLEEYGSTGCLEAIKLAIDQTSPSTVFPIYHQSGGKRVIGDCVVLGKNTTINELLEYVDTELVAPPLRVERPDGRELSGNDTIENNNVIVFRHCTKQY